MKEGCPLLPKLFLLYYDVLLRETFARLPKANLYVFVDDIAIRADDQGGLLDTLSRPKDVAHRMGLRFNVNKIKVYLARPLHTNKTTSTRRYMLRTPEGVWEPLNAPRPLSSFGVGVVRYKHT